MDRLATLAPVAGFGISKKRGSLLNACVTLNIKRYSWLRQTGDIGAGGWFVNFCSVAATDELAAAHEESDEDMDIDEGVGGSTASPLKIKVPALECFIFALQGGFHVQF